MTFEQANGSRAQVWHGTAKHTKGGLTKSQLKKNKHGSIVSRKASARAKKENRLVKAGYLTKKGQFGFIKNGTRMRKGRKGSKGSKRMRGGMHALSPSPISGIKGTSGVDLQFIAGNAA